MKRVQALKPADMDAEVLTHEQVMVILSEQARQGSVTAAAALERALRAQARKEEEAEVASLEELLRTK